MRIFLEEMMFDRPDIVETEPVGELNLVERILVELLLQTLGPGPRQLKLVEQTKAHCPALPS